MPDSSANGPDISGQPWHIHVINSPDMTPYCISAETLEHAFDDLVRGGRVSLTVTESSDATAVTDEMRDAEILVCQRLPRSRIAEIHRLRLIHLASAGVDHLLPLTWLPRGVMLTNSSGIHSDVAGEYVSCALLMLNIGIPAYIGCQRDAVWKPDNNMSIRGKAAVVVGLGALGGAAAQHAKNLGLRVIGVRRRSHPHRYADTVVGPEALARVLPQADFLVIAIPLTPATRGMIGRREIGLLKSDAGVVNISRSAVVDTAALAERLDRRELRGAVVDVWDEEPLPPQSGYWQVRNMILTPHISADVPPRLYGERVMRLLKDHTVRLMAGRPLRNRVSRTYGY
jgi:glyoxylate/hydroxypyruvate reductase